MNTEQWFWGGIWQGAHSFPPSSSQNHGLKWRSVHRWIRHSRMVNRSLKMYRRDWQYKRFHSLCIVKERSFCSRNKNESTNNIIALIASIRWEANQLILCVLEEQGITDILPAHGAVLHALFQKSPMQMSELADVINRKKNTVTGLISTLESRGYCHREKDPLDGRAQCVMLTPKGEEVRRKQAKVSQVLLEKLWHGIAGEDQQKCMQTLQKVYENLCRSSRNELAEDW